jgi:hypothetical protein
MKDGDKKNVEYIKKHPGFAGWVLNKYRFEKQA